MKAVIHMGLHKTGSTLVQYLAVHNAKALLRAGIYFKLNLGYPAHHAEAAGVLGGDFRPIAKILSRAARLGAEAVFISSENFENLLFAPQATLALCQWLRAAGCEEIVFAIYVRDQVETFWSLYAEHSRHVPLDAHEMLRDALNRGFYAVDPERGPEAQRRQWRFSLDHASLIPPFRQAVFEAVGAHVRAYDYHHFDRYPGDAMFRDMGVERMITRMPVRMVLNPRLSPEAVKANFRRRYAGRPDLPLPDFLTLDAASELRRRGRISELLRERFAGTNARLMAALADPPADVPEPGRG
jgi:hypothetical protein